ncbi:uncharacterized protein K452DRAFT_307318 [Aplosporella prunicola CBS 121167]|uniref:Uncharacterized protein n=1 Tax=Aplosporella prunicola CBS 121167 TaxID=1176127 RepID=A0A6A6BKP1_9PEZI|nr:uncharacterized protein K452DRAFT_307318 [Aplosporella prunicola CBS 121167]KAF2143141.1 hypothetical protein K452DRAFT_307318 [Aplosporella prunicola CBS 121167]
MTKNTAGGAQPSQPTNEQSLGMQDILTALNDIRDVVKDLSLKVSSHTDLRTEIRDELSSLRKDRGPLRIKQLPLRQKTDHNASNVPGNEDLLHDVPVEVESMPKCPQSTESRHIALEVNRLTNKLTDKLEKMTADPKSFPVDGCKLLLDKSKLAINYCQSFVDEGKIAIDKCNLALERSKAAINDCQSAIDRNDVVFNEFQSAIEKRTLPTDRNKPLRSTHLAGDIPTLPQTFYDVEKLSRDEVDFLMKFMSSSFFTEIPSTTGIPSIAGNIPVKFLRSHLTGNPIPFFPKTIGDIWKLSHHEMECILVHLREPWSATVRKTLIVLYSALGLR